MATSKACAKIILIGEHAVVYGRAGIALPVKGCQTIVTIAKADSFSYTVDREIDDLDKQKIEKLLEFIFTKLQISLRGFEIQLESNFPFGAGMGSSASIAIALLRGFSNYFNLDFKTEKINELSFECEKIFHGNPSGIDNTVISYEKPIFYKNKKIDFIELKKPLSIIIANTGIKAATIDVVLGVKKRYEENSEKYTQIFNEIDNISRDSKECLEKGELKKLGKLMIRNHELLGEMGVSSIELDGLVNKALKAGAYGAKLAGAGKGGNIIALVDDNSKHKVIVALKEAKAKEIFYTVVS